MPPKLPACDPCRFSKLACDHAQPVCSRCRDRNRAEACTYRLRPFKKRKKQLASGVRHGRLSSSSTLLVILLTSHTSPPSPSRTEASLARFLAKSRHYPNPGYQGSSSHATFFDHLPLGSTNGVDGQALDIGQNDAKVAHGAKLIEQFHHSSHVLSWIALVEAWLSSGASLVLARIFTDKCAQTTHFVLSRFAEGVHGAMEISRGLFVRSSRPLKADVTTTLEEFSANFCNHNARWETLGLFFTAASRATLDLALFEPLYASDQERRRFQRLAMHYSDRCLEIALSLDCLNDLQLILQYENFILHSFMDGDQSQWRLSCLDDRSDSIGYHSWRKLGDVIGSLYALGYHEEMEATPIPTFLKTIRQVVFARAFSADKNISIFLGRPPRIIKNYCKIQFPNYDAANDDEGTSQALQQPARWGLDDYMADTRWSALCAVLKEDILMLFQEESYDERIRTARIIQAKAEEQWAALPPSFRLEGPLKSYDRRPVERDLLASARINHLHVLFLLRLALLRRMTEPDARLVAISAEMLSVVVEAIVLKDQLKNSGTSLVWKVAYYGLAAAGMICLALLNQSFIIESKEVSVSKVVQDLSVLVAEIETGTLVHLEDPNYALLVGATHTIKSLLNRLMSGGLGKQTAVQPVSDPLSQSAAIINAEDWGPWDNRSLQDFETDFWVNLAEHPFLLGPENELQGL